MRVLSSRLRELKLQRGGQRRLAELAGVAPNTLIQWRKGRGNPRLSELEALADAMRVSIVYLVKRRERRDSYPTRADRPER